MRASKARKKWRYVKCKRKSSHVMSCHAKTGRHIKKWRHVRGKNTKARKEHDHVKHVGT